MTARHDPAVRKYLARYAEDTALHGAAVGSGFERSLVIPACGEGPTLDRVLASVPRGAGPTLAVVVVNAPAGAPGSVLAANRDALLRLRSSHPPAGSAGPGIERHRAAFGTLVVVERTLPAGQGVGLARKLGHDLALAAWSAGRVRSPWIWSADADVVLPPDFFRAPSQPGAAALGRFRHHPSDPSLAEPARVYDLWLRYHVLGLRWAGSPYAFHTIGSTVVVDAPSYAAVRGFPRRAAAEDFYLLNKLAKVGPVRQRPGAPISIAARVSGRVPFGTGRSLGDALRGRPQVLDRFLPPALYRCLGVLLAQCEACIESAAPLMPALEKRLAAAGLDPSLGAPVRAAGIEAALGDARQRARTRARQVRAFHQWFDAFRTMKLLHAMRDRSMPALGCTQALADAEFLLAQGDEDVADDVAVVRGALERMRAA